MPPVRRRPRPRLDRAKETLDVTLTIDRAASRVAVSAEADLGGTTLRALPLLGNYAGPETMRANATVECASSAIEVVLALDVTPSMHGRIDNALPARGDNRWLASERFLSVMTQGAVEPS